MPRLPKIALARLKAKPDAPKSPGGTEGQSGFPGADHLDANLLAAFAEKTLTQSERTQVLNHLAQCAECREVAAFTLPAEAAEAEPARVATGRRWTPWLILRWGAMAAVLGALTVVVILHPDMWKGPQEMKIPPPAPAGNIANTPQTIPAPPLAQPSPEPARVRAQSEARESANELAATKKPAGQSEDLAQNDHVARAQAKQQVTMMASSRPPATIRAGNVSGVNVEREEGEGGNALAAGALPAPAPSPAPASLAMTASDEAAKAGAESQAGPESLRATTQGVAVTGRSAGGFGGGGGSGISAGVATAKSAPPMASDASVHAMAQAPMGALRTFRTGSSSEAKSPAALWSVSADGKVQRSTDGGKTFEQVLVAHEIKFQAIASLGNDVWAGGAGGALFHSVDGGATWKQADFNFEGNAITETIAEIQLRDPQHLSLTTASGSQWVSEDGGQHWQKHP
jgi:hypothetical protein